MQKITPIKGRNLEIIFFGIFFFLILHSLGPMKLLIFMVQFWKGTDAPQFCIYQLKLISTTNNIQTWLLTLSRKPLKKSIEGSEEVNINFKKDFKDNLSEILIDRRQEEMNLNLYGTNRLGYQRKVSSEWNRVMYSRRLGIGTYLENT